MGSIRSGSRHGLVDGTQRPQEQQPQTAATDAGPAQAARLEPRFQYRQGQARAGLSAALEFRRRHARDGGLVPAKRLECPATAFTFFKEIPMELQGERAAVLIEQQYQEMEVWYPIYRLRE